MVGEESIDSIKMGVALVFFTVILGYVISNTRFGRDMLSSAVDGIAEAADHTAYQNFYQFTGDGTDVTAAAAYAFIGYNENQIASVTCYVHGTEGVTGYGLEDTCLKNHLQGRVHMKAVYDRNEEEYHLVIRKGED